MPRLELPLRIGDAPHQLRARLVLAADGEPVRDAVVVIEGGRIADVRLATASDASVLDLGNVAIIPGLINAHAHLEFSDLSEPIQPPDPFTGWIRNLIGYRNSRQKPQAELIADGLIESFKFGTTTVGEIATGDWSATMLANRATPLPHLIAFRECIGLRPERQAEQLNLINEHIAIGRALKASDDQNARRLIPAISPHAPYSVSFELFEALVAIAKRERVPLCMHLAETRAELELLDRGAGEFVDMLKAFGIWDATLFREGTRPLDYLQKLADVETALIAHGNYLSDAEIEFLGRHPNIAVVFCPRTHHFFGHAEHPWRRLLAVGANVCLGTDGRSSNPDYSLWAELQFLDRLTNGSMRPQLLEMATARAAQALGLADRAGRISQGLDADLAIVQLPSSDAVDPYDLLFGPADQTRPIATIIGGIVAT